MIKKRTVLLAISDSLTFVIMIIIALMLLLSVYSAWSLTLIIWSTININQRFVLITFCLICLAMISMAIVAHIKKQKFLLKPKSSMVISQTKKEEKMKRIIFLAVVFAAFVINPVLAQEPISTMVDLRHDFFYPKKGENLTAQSLKILWQHNWLAGFLESDFKSSNHALTLKPSLLLRHGPWYFLGGLSANSQGSDFVQAGIWHVNRFGNFNILLDLRNYWSISGKGNNYMDNLLRVMYPLVGKLSIGTELGYDHWWNTSNHNWFLVGPRISYQLTKELSIYVRVSREWDVLGNKTEETDRIRTAIQFNF